MKKFLAVILILSACASKESKKTGDSTDTTKSPVVDTIKTSVPDSTSSADSDSAKIIGTAIKLGKIEVAANDFPNLMIWDEAKRACEGLGQGWRLPSKEELNAIYKAKSSLGSFSSDLYWSADEADEMNAETQNMFNGKQGRFSKIYMCKTRAVRSL